MSDAYPAARGLDTITHSVELCGLIGGSLIGAFVGGLVLGAAIASGPLVIAVAAVGAVGAVGMGGISGGQLAKGLQTVFQLPDPETGTLALNASPDVWVGGRRSARAQQDAAATCHGLWSLAHPVQSSVKIAEGSKTVIVNGFPAARVTSKLVCGAAISAGETTVIIGGPTIRVLAVHDLETELKEIFGLMNLTAVVGLIALAPGSVPILAGFLALFYVAGELGDRIGPGWGDILQGTLGLAALGLPARTALRSPRGSLRIEPGEFSASEIRAAEHVAHNLGRHVVLRQPVGPRSGGGTSDLVVDGVSYDVYTPRTSNPNRVISAMAKKNSQAEGIVLDLTNRSVRQADLGNILARVRGAGATRVTEIIVIGGD